MHHQDSSPSVKTMRKWLIYAEVEIPVASNRSPVADKTLVASNLESITVTSDVDMFYFTLVLK